MAHEILVEIFKNRPRLAAELLAESFGVEMPQYEGASIAAEGLTEIQPAEYRADLVIKLEREGKAVRVIVVEVQLKVDLAKRFSWPVYITVCREEHLCPATLLVVAPDADVAKWCEEPIETGVPEFVLKPPVLKKNRVPKIKDPAEATRRPELALLSAMAHGDSEEVVEIGQAALEGFSSLDPQRGSFYTDIMYNAINEAARRVLEVRMKDYVYTAPFIVELIEKGVQQGFEQGRDEGVKLGRDEGVKLGRDEGVKLGRDEGVKLGRDEGVKLGRDEGVKLGRDEGVKLAARSLIGLMQARGMDIPDHVRQRILGEQDIHRVELWLERALCANSVADVINEPN